MLFVLGLFGVCWGGVGFLEVCRSGERGKADAEKRLQGNGARVCFCVLLAGRCQGGTARRSSHRTTRTSLPASVWSLLKKQTKNFQIHVREIRQRRFCAPPSPISPTYVSPLSPRPRAFDIREGRWAGHKKATGSPLD